MDPVATVVDKLNGLAKSAQDFALGLLNSRHNSNRRSPIEILKRLQREAFSDIMKIRDRQDKVERLLSFYKSSKGSPFQESSTHVKGKVDVLGALFFMSDLDEQKFQAIQRSGVRTGIDARLTFETSILDGDTLAAEFMAGDKGQGDGFGSPLLLEKVTYRAHMSNWLSAIAIPTGARCRDVSVTRNSHQERAPTECSEFGPPLLNQYTGGGIGFMVRKLNVVASLAQFVSNLGLNSPDITNFSSTFGQVVLQLPGNTKFSLLGMRRQPSSSNESINLGGLAFLVSSIFNRNSLLGTSAVEDNPRSSERLTSEGSIALMLNSELDESTRIGGWVEMKNSNPGHFQWAVTIRDTPEEEFGWGLTVGGSLQGAKNLDHFQVETFLNLNFGSRFKLQPAILYVKDGVTQFPAIMLSSSWSL